MLGTGFDGRSAQDFRVKPTAAGALQRSCLQLRPGETFYVKNLTLTLVPVEEHDDLIQFASVGNVPSYNEYSQHISQKRAGESQAFPTPSPKKLAGARSIPQTPTKTISSARGHTSVIQNVNANGLDGKSNSEGGLQHYGKRSALHVLREPNSLNAMRVSVEADELSDLSPMLQDIKKSKTPSELSMEPQTLNLGKAPLIPDRPKLITKISQKHQPKAHHEPALHDTQESTELQVSYYRKSPALGSPALDSSRPVKTQAIESDLNPSRMLAAPQLDSYNGPEEEMPGRERSPPRKRRKVSPRLVHTSADESQDSVAGKSITVAARKITPPTESTYQSISEERPSASTCSATTIPQTPFINNSFREQSSGNILEPTSSMRSTRSAQIGSPSTISPPNSDVRILFASSTSVGDSKAFKKFLAKQKVTIVQSSQEASLLCVGKGELKKTSKVISAVLFGLNIITDDWVTDSARLKKLQDVRSYLARDPLRESEWGIKLDEAIQRGRQRVQVLKGWTVIFTAKAKRDLGKTGFADLKEIATGAGAENIRTSLPKEQSSESEPPILIIGSPEDANTPCLQDRRCFTKDIISLSVLRGCLDIESDEFLIKTEPRQPAGHKKRKR